MAYVEARGLSQRFVDGERELVLFDELDFSAECGEITVIMGPSGSGKSSLLKQLSTIVPIASGSLTIASETVGTYGEKKRAGFRSNNVGFIFQSYALLEELTLLQNCMVPLQIQNIGKKEARSRALELLQQLLPDVDYDKYPYQLSGGEQQRVSVVRALVHNPGLVIADEPTGNLDEVNAKKVREQLKHIAKELGKCVVIVTHEQAYEPMADRLYRFSSSGNDTVKSILNVAID